MTLYIHTHTHTGTRSKPAQQQRATEREQNNRQAWRVSTKRPCARIHTHTDAHTGRWPFEQQGSGSQCKKQDRPPRFCLIRRQCGSGSRPTIQLATPFFSHCPAYRDRKRYGQMHACARARGVRVSPCECVSMCAVTTRCMTQEDHDTCCNRAVVTTVRLFSSLPMTWAEFSG